VNTALDTNILLRHAAPNDPDRPTVILSIRTLRADGHVFRLVPQNLYEFWVVATRPVAQNGLGLSAGECDRTLTAFEAMFPPLLDSPTLTAEWRSLVTTHGCLGKPAHDARIVAAMNTHGVTHLVTFNTADFRRYPHLTLHDPKVLAAAAGGTP
jgi:predicted nucleic acid-binding protein